MRYPDDGTVNHLSIIHFAPRVTEKQAIRAAEAFLNQPLTKEWLAARADALFDTGLTWQQAQDQGYTTRGSLLTDMTFLESIDNEDGYMTMNFDS